MCPTLCGPMDCSLPGSTVHEILQARILEWVAMSYSRYMLRYPVNISSIFLQYQWSHGFYDNKRKKESEVLSCVRLFVTTWTVAHQAPLSVEFSRQEYWSGLPFSSPGIFLTQGSNLHLLWLLHWQADSLPRDTWEALQSGKPIFKGLMHRLYPKNSAKLPDWKSHGL